VSPGSDRGRPGEEAPPKPITTNTDRIASQADSRRSPRRRGPSLLTFQGRLARCRRISRELDNLLEVDIASVKPSTFSLTLAEIKAEANRLYAAGWTVAEITAVLAIEPGGGR
jgi:hypothetical protein